MATLIHARDLAKRHGLKHLFDGVGITVHTGDRLGIIGPNGGGKSTLLKILAGMEDCDEGTVTRQKGVSMAYVAQSDTFKDAPTVLDAAMAPMLMRGMEHFEAEIAAMSSLGEAGFEDFDASPASLSGGWKKRLSLARALASDPELLMLDEPTNHLDLAGVLWLEEILGRFKGAVVMVSHDRMFLERTVQRMLELSSAYPGGTFEATGAYDAFVEKREEFLETQLRQQQAMAGKVRRDTAWLQRGVKARRTRNKTQIAAAAERRGELASLANRNRGAQTAGITFNASERQTRKLLEVLGVSKTMGTRKLFSNLELLLSPGSRVGLLGDNGCGKTTLIRCLTGQLQPDAGTIKLADKLRVVHFSQHRESLPQTMLLRNALQGGTGGEGGGGGGDRVDFQGNFMHIASWAERFLFDKEALDTPVSSLSGGEQARVLIARLMLQPADVLILDEPTNDLDIPTLDVLEDAMESFPGAVLLVTHDRFMLDRVCDTLLELGADAGPDCHAFHYSLDQYEQAQVKREADAKAAAKAGQKAEAKKPHAPPPPPPPKPKVKLANKEQYELDHMEKSIADAEAQVAKLEAMTLSPAVQGDHQKLTAHYIEQGKAQERVQALFARWDALLAKQEGN